MVSLNGIGRQNTLMRWLQRHARVATLFHPAEQSSHRHAAFLSVQPARTTSKPENHEIPEKPENMDLATQEINQPDLDLWRAITRAEAPPRSANRIQISRQSLHVTDQDWKRLEKIFHGHQRGQEASSPQEGEDNYSKPDASDPLIPDGQRINQAPRSHIRRKKTTTFPNSSQVLGKPDDEEKVPGKSNGYHTPSARRGENGEQELTPVVYAPRIVESQAGTGLESEEEMPHGGALLDGSLRQDNPEPSGLIQAKRVEPHGSDFTVVKSNPLHETQYQPVPLEVAWPVQRVFPGSATSPEKTEILKAEERVLGNENTIPSGEKSTAAVVAGEATPSLGQDMEILTPSRPRPANTKVAGSSPPVIQSKRSDETGTGDQPAAFVQTSIGPLPSDLWQLLGQAPPEKPESISIGEGQTTKEKASVPHELAVIESVRESPGNHSTAIQRQAEQIATPLKGTETPPLMPEVPQFSRQNEKQEMDSDLEEITRLVYAEVRRRLKLEQERNHGRV